MISVLLGPKWNAAAPIFRLLAPTILVFAIINPLSWLLGSVGRVGRLVKMSSVITPLMIAGYFAGLPYGPKGVACAYSALMLLWVFPAIAWAVQDTGISFWDILQAVRWPLASGAVAAMLAFGTRSLYGHLLPPLPRLILEGVVMLATYLGMLFFATGQKPFYLDLLRTLRGSSSVEEVKEKDLVSV
jgi:PST family polysaccharide transporter